MSRKSDLYALLKEKNVTFEKSYVYYTEAELEGLYFQHMAEQSNSEEAASTIENVSEFRSDSKLPDSGPEPVDPALGTTAAPVAAELGNSAPPEWAVSNSERPARAPETLEELQQFVVSLFQQRQLKEGQKFFYQGHEIPVRNDGADRAGLTYSVPPNIPIRIDESARIWFADEVQKPAIPKARMTRKTRYIDSGVKQVRSMLPNGQLDEVYEVAGDERRELTVTTTLPSWQVGRYRDPRFPFMVHTYNDSRGFDQIEVARFFGGYELIPRTIKRLYVGNQLCYHIPTTREAIENQFKMLQKGN